MGVGCHSKQKELFHSGTHWPQGTLTRGCCNSELKKIHVPPLISLLLHRVHSSDAWGTGVMGTLMPGKEAPTPGGLRSVGLAKKFIHIFHHIYRKTQMSFLANPIFVSIMWVPFKGFPGGKVVKNLPANAGNERDTSSIPGSGRSPGGGNGNHSSILYFFTPVFLPRKSHGQRILGAIVRGVAKS